jgi:para-nitrobenzyl esterase
MSTASNVPVRAVRGIRYAVAERFSPPEALPYSPGDELGTSGPMCPQLPGMLERMLGADVSNASEDCLFLDVFAPEGAAPGSLPVLVWVHGGAYLNGSGSAAWYDGSRLAARGAVVVSINYRLGAFGYLGTRNLGLLDQITALAWVQRHVAPFGGDPGNVTIFGESAGGSAVVSLLAAPATKGLVHRAWSMSPSIRQLRGTESARRWEAEFIAAAGVSSVDEARALSVDDVLAAQAKVLALGNTEYDMFAPTAGGDGLPADILAAAAANPMPWCVGTNRDENLLFLAFDPNYARATVEQWEKHLVRTFGDRAAEARAAYELARPEESPLNLISAVQTDHGFRRPAQKLAEARVAAGNPSWMYWFTWASPAFDGLLGSAHALDIPFAFDNLDAPGSALMLGDAGLEGTHRLAAKFADEIVGFARTGAASWPGFDTVTRPTLRLDTEIDLLHDPEPDLRALHD